MRRRGLLLSLGRKAGGTKLFSGVSQLPASQSLQNPLDYLFLNKSEVGGSSLECTRIALLAGISRNSELSGSSRNADVEGASWPIPAPCSQAGPSLWQGASSLPVSE